MTNIPIQGLSIMFDVILDRGFVYFCDGNIWYGKCTFTGFVYHFDCNIGYDKHAFAWFAYHFDEIQYDKHAYYGVCLLIWLWYWIGGLSISVMVILDMANVRLQGLSIILIIILVMRNMNSQVLPHFDRIEYHKKYCISSDQIWNWIMHGQRWQLNVVFALICLNIAMTKRLSQLGMEKTKICNLI